MEGFADFDVEEGQTYELEVHLVNDDIGDRVGVAPAGAVRVGADEVVNEDETIQDAVELAKDIDVSILLTELSSDHESEGLHRKSLDLPGRVSELIGRVVEANPNAVCSLHLAG